MGKIKKIFSSWKVWLLAIVLLLSLWSVFNIEEYSNGNLKISYIEKNSSFEAASLETGAIISKIQGSEIETASQLNEKLDSHEPGEIITLTTKQGLIFKKTNEFKILVQENMSSKIRTQDVSSINLNQGLDLVGGARVILKPSEETTSQQFSDIMAIIEERLNVYGLKDINIQSVTDLSGEKYIRIEIAGASKEEIIDLVSNQGKFEAKIANETIFVGGTDIKSVCRDASCSGVNLQSCGQSQEGAWSCRYNFRIDISPSSAEKFAQVTSTIPVEFDSTSESNYLSEPIDLYLDNTLVESLNIAAALKGEKATSITISGPGTSSTKQGAANSAIENMNKMQTLLITGSLPVKLEISKVDIVSPILGSNFLKYAFISFALALLGVGAVVLVRYRKLKIAIPILITSISEIIIILGVASIIKWNIDLAAIAGILAAVGTGVDHQIVITDEVLRGERESSWKQRIKSAFFIIMAAYFTTLVAMGPLYFMGTGLLKGFAVTTVIGITAGVLITRPAFAKIIESLLKE